MGLYAPRCALSGIVLEGGLVGLTLVVGDGQNWRPAALPIWGTYDGYGELESIVEDSATDRLVEGFRRAIHAGLVKVNWEALLEPTVDFSGVGQLVHVAARSMVMPKATIACGGERLACVFIAGHLASAFVDGPPATDIGFTTCQPWNTIYGDRLSQGDCQATYRQFLSIHQAVIRFGSWQPTGMGQFDDQEKLEYVSSARDRLPDVPAVREFLRDFEDSIEGD